MRWKTFLILLGLAIIGFILRLHLMPSNLFFGPEQGNDFKIIQGIVYSHKWTLIGPKTDISGIFHGPLYYYLASIPFYISHGDPYVVARFFILLQSISVFCIFLLTFEITGNRRTAFIASILYTCSFGAITYSRWLSGQPLSIPLSCLFSFFIIKFLKGNSLSLFGAALCFGLMGQSEFINFILFAGVGLAILLSYRNSFFTQSKLLLLFSLCIALICSLGNFILFDFRHEFLISKSLFGLFTGIQKAPMSYGDAIRTPVVVFLDSAKDILGLPNNWIAVFVLGIQGIVFLRGSWKNLFYRIVLFWIYIPIVVLIVLRHGALIQVYVGIVAGLIIGLAMTLEYVEKKWNKLLGICMMFLLIFSNILLWYKNIPTNTRVFFQTTQPEVKYSDQINVVRYIYEKAEDRSFYFQAYTIPYFWQDGWEYLFWYYAKKNRLKEPEEKHDELLYVIIQADRSNPRFQYDWYINTVTHWGLLRRTVTIGEFTVEERVNEHKHER